MATPKDPLTPAVNKVLWPYLKEIGFMRCTPRKFVREKNDVFQQLWVDANGVAGKRSTRIVLCANLPFGPVDGYMDPHGFSISNGRRWDASTPESAEKAMHNIVEALKASAMAQLEAMSSVEALMGKLESFHQRGWYETHALHYQQWLAREPEIMAVVQENRLKLKL